MLGKIVLRGVLAAVVVACGLAAQANNVNLNLVTGWNVNWNPSTDTTSGTQNISIVNAAASANTVFTGYDLGIGFTRVSGTGKLAVASLANPSSNPAVPDFGGLPAAGTEPDTGAGTGILVGNSSNTNGLFSVPTSAVNLLALSFDAGSAAPSAGSVFDVWALGAATSGGESDFVDNNGNPFPYANTGPMVNANGDVLLGTVTIVTVPEPNTLVLLGVAGLALSAYRLRRGTRRHAQAA